MAKSEKKPDKKTSKTVERLEEYVRLMKDESLDEIEVSDGTTHVKLVRERAGGAHPAHHYAPSAPPPVQSLPAVPEEKSGNPIEAPIGGVFYRAASPSSPAFVQEGDTIAPGQVLCIIEAMKVMNEITAEKSGKVVKVLAENGQSVDVGRVLFLLESGQ